jgi:hypothetical protein
MKELLVSGLVTAILMGLSHLFGVMSAQQLKAALGWGALAVAAVVLLAFVALAVYSWIRFRPLRKKEPGTDYVYLKTSGTVRELSSDEQEHLNEKFLPGDGARPYIIFSYEEKPHWPGFIPRRRVPTRILIQPNPQS